MSLAFVLYIFLGFNKFFQLGFVLTLARLPGSDEASPVVSKYWPLVVVLRVVTVPSTNWSIAGNLTYPYFPRMLDRVNYVLGAIVLMFVFDRAGRYISCEPLPTVLATTTLLLYLLHPVLMAFILSIFSNGSWFREANQVWLGSLVLCLALVWSAGAIKQVVSRRRSKKEQEASSSEDEDSET
ncbi:unnamed protein product [Polarella glacialis]|uniref:Acyltransferase 3 domain-containing protein n=2 Tax=Polarella glacialis TaxID=89957 RepID=A0A813ECF9_POLGL|nr:unnamed protein product [Polarella glacialis]